MDETLSTHVCGVRGFSEETEERHVVCKRCNTASGLRPSRDDAASQLIELYAICDLFGSPATFRDENSLFSSSNTRFKVLHVE